MKLPTKERTCFPAKIAKKYIVKRQILAPGEREETIPLKGDKGSIYIYSSDYAGFWLNTGHPARIIKKIKQQLIEATIKQIGDHELTFIVPFQHLEKAMKVFPGRRKTGRSHASPKQLAALAKGREKLKKQQ